MKCAQNYAQQLTVLDPTEVTNSDHASFWRQGYTAIKLRENIRCDKVYHTVKDTFGHPEGLNNPKQVTRVTKTNVALLCEAAKLNGITSLVDLPGSDGSALNGIAVWIQGRLWMIPVKGMLRENDQFRIALYKSNGQCCGISTVVTYSRSMKQMVFTMPKHTTGNLGNGLYLIKINHASGASYSVPVVLFRKP
jgi:hypothetical protein